MYSLLFVCTGNTCRSPLAAHLAAHAAAGRGLSPLELRVASAGLSAADGVPATDKALAAGRELGLDLSQHRAARLTPALVGQADLVLAMTRSQKSSILAMYPRDRQKVYTLKEYVRPDCADQDVADPFGQPLAVYRRTAQELKILVDQLVDKIGGGASAPGHR